MGHEEIFVAIASYRDPELVRTIRSCVDNAVRPDRLRFGICLQHDREGPAETWPGCLDGLDVDARVLSYDWAESKGGCWARHRAQGLYDGEQYTLQIDSHVRMTPGWDEGLVAMMTEFPGDKPLITGQLPLYDVVDRVDVFPARTPEVAVTIMERFSPDGWIHHPSAIVATETLVPRPTRVLSGMFVFTLGQWNLEVRQDPEHLYTGEELALTIRSFTHGYDLYNPSRIVAWHRHHPEGNLKYIHDAAPAEVRRRHDRAMRRLRLLHRGDPDRVLEPYSVGWRRSVDEYHRWAGIDYPTRSIGDDARRGVTPPVFQPLS